MTPQELKNSILQLAIQGKLVEQRLEEGTGEELYQQIQAEKQRLIKAGVIKKEKPLPEIAEAEKPFDIPESWKWVRLGNVAVIQSSKRVFEKDYVPNGIPFFRSKEIGDLYRGEDIRTELFITREHYEHLNKLYGVPKVGDILITSVGTIGNTWICDNREFYYKDGNITQICSNGYFEPAYIERFIHSPLFEMQALSTVSGTAYSALTIIKLKNIIVPLPPLAEQKRIVAKIEELLPYIDHYEKAWSKLEDFNKRFPNDMQKSILQMAIQGKLVGQRQGEGTGEELYHQIQAEKQQLIKAGTVKKEKPLQEITEDEKPFDIPENWKWVRLGSLAELITKGSSPSWQGIKYIDEGLLFVTSENVGVEQLLLDTPKYLEKRFNEIQERSILKKGDILTNIVGASIGRTAIYDRDELANINQAVCLIRLVNKRLNSYITKYLNSYVAYKIMMNDKVDTARANISLTNISDFIVPLPPLSEQKRIVDKLEEILPLCEKLK